MNFVNLTLMNNCLNERTELQSSVDGTLRRTFKVLKVFGALSEYGNSTADDEVASYVRLGPFSLT